MEWLEQRILLTTVTAVDPPANSHSAAVSTEISAIFDQDITAAAAQTFVVQGTQSRGRLLGAATSVSVSGPVAMHDPTNNFFPGETVQVTVTSGVVTAGGAATPRVWQFRTENTSGSGQFVDSGQVLGANEGNDVKFGDLDGDGDLDSVHGGNLVWLNDGSGVFSNTGQSLSVGDFDLVDLDGDDDLDVVGLSTVWLNDGGGTFSNTGQNLLGGLTVEAGDIDGDGDNDVLQGVAYIGNRVWINDGGGTFTNSGQSLGNSSSNGIQLGDLDSDGDLDAFVANNGTANRVWLNDGNGVFTDSTQTLGGIRASLDVDLGDLDGDGDLDAFVASNNQTEPSSSVLFNDGNGVFTDSGQLINANGNSWTAELGDLDADGDLDVFINGTQNPSVVWWNDGAGVFSDSGQQLNFPGLRRARGLDLGDVDGDGDLDAWESNTFSGGGRLWINQNLTPTVTLAMDSPTIGEAGGTATATATLSAAFGAPVTIDLGYSGTATNATDYTAATQIVIPAGSTSGSATITAIQDTVDEPDETVIVDITSITNGQESGRQQVTTTILDDDELPVPDVSLTVDRTSIPEAGGVAVFTATLSVGTTIPVVIDLGLSGSAAASDYGASSIQIVVAPGATSGSMVVTAVQDEVDEPDETVIVDIAAVTGGNELGTQQQTTTIIDDDNPPSFMVASLAPTSAGFVAELNSDLDTSVLNLYGSGFGDADAVLTGASSGPVSGSLVVDPTLRRVSFVRTGDPLAADTYTVRLRSADNGFRDLAGNLLDGDGNGIGGGDFVESFTVAPPAPNSVTVAVPDFVRGPGQDVHLPAGTTNGIPLSISPSEGASVRAVDLRISYDPALLEITAATVGAAMPAGASVVVNTNTPGLAILVFFSTAPLPVGTNTLVHLQASVPTVNAGENYGRSQVLDIHSVVVSDGMDNESPVTVDDAIQLASYFADVSGNGRINASDASQVARFAAFLETGFAGSQLTDPMIVGDISGNGRINATDASLLAQFAARIPVPEIPPIPVGVVVAGAGFGSHGLLQPPQAPLKEEPERNLEEPLTASAAPGTLLDDDPAIDRLMTALAEPRGSTDGEEFHGLLDVVVDELFSALDLEPSG